MNVYIKRNEIHMVYERTSLFIIFKVNVRQDQDTRLEEFKRRKNNRFISQY